MEFSENTRVKIPTLVHATRLGYKYLSLKDYKNEIDEETNIFKNVFKKSINSINNIELSDDNITKLINELSFSLKNDDLGRQFYKYLINGYKGIKLIDFEDEKNNESKGKVVASILVTVLVIAITIGIIFMLNKSDEKSDKKLAFTEFMSHINEGNIEKIEMTNGSNSLTVTLKGEGEEKDREKTIIFSKKECKRIVKKDIKDTSLKDGVN